MEQEDRYLSTFDFKAKDQVEEESEKFFNKYMRDRTFKQLVDNTYYKEYPMLVKFSGVLATIFPGTSIVGSDFSIIGWEKDEYRTQLSNLSLEGILHAKQFDEMH